MTDTNFPGFSALDFEILIFHDFPGFPWPVGALTINMASILFLGYVLSILKLTELVSFSSGIVLNFDSLNGIISQF